MVILEIILFKPGPIQVSYEYTFSILFPTRAFYVSFVPLLAQGMEIHPGKYDQRTNKVKKIWSEAEWDGYFSSTAYQFCELEKENQ